MCTTCNQSQPNKDCPCCAPEIEELIECYECEQMFPDKDIEVYDNVPLCPECLKSYKLELAIDFNEFDE